MSSPAALSLPLDLGTVHPLSASEVADWILTEPGGWNGPRVLSNLNLHGLYMRETHPEFRMLTEQADLTIIDGWPILLLAKRSAKKKNVGLASRHRVGSTDWLEEIVARDQPMRIVAVGGTEETAAGAARWALEHSTRITWTAFSGYGSHVDEPGPDLIAELSKADLVLVGLGMPRQEEWIVRNQRFVNGVIANVGGCLDYFAGAQSLAPRWMGRLGLEWFFRLVKDPRRLARRYLVEPFELIWVVVRRKTSAKDVGAGG
ncbi:hypothetical protein A9Z40_12840 [Microbacterium arborescens]|uniref:Glycosyltransferase n=1 Tax=Microbacterium arborescens TaxID=33883 RepID=A0ABX2WLP4_9MICO|nr:WecB/TagA/CpsF family glycosyltransferase [Microbacterium arborescens]OAZ44271.1 hypothetical protein A9Z40_12840 [Microbacterium arborescens]